MGKDETGLGFHLESWRDIRNDAADADGATGGPANNHAVGSPGESPGRRVALLVTRLGGLLRVLHRLRHLPTAGDFDGARGPRWWWWARQGGVRSGGGGSGCAEVAPAEWM